MTAKSSKFKTLEKELALLRKHLLPRVFNATGSYPARIYTRTTAYRVLAHAEFEEYLEGRVQEVAINAITGLTYTGKINRVIACLIAFIGQKLEGPPDTIDPPSGTPLNNWNGKLALIEKVKHANNSFQNGLIDNHGIREKNILNLVLPVGIQPHQIDRTWLIKIDNFGQLRGRVAHHSASTYRATHLPDPKTEYETVKEILAGLRTIDDYLNKVAQ